MLAVRFSNAAGRRFLEYRIGGVSPGPKPPPRLADFLRSATGLDDNLIDGVMAAISNGNLMLLSRASVAEAAGAEAAPVHRWQVRAHDCAPPSHGAPAPDHAAQTIPSQWGVPRR